MGVVMVRLVGAFAVSVVGSGAEIDVGSRKARVLLALLASRRGRAVPLDEIVDVLWVERRPRRPHREVATLVSRLRGRLGRDVVVGGSAGYRLGGPPAVVVDLDEAVRLVVDGRARLVGGDPGFAVAAGRSACDLLGVGVAVADVPDAEWVQDLRAEHTALLRSARHLRAEAALLVGESTEAIEVAEVAVRADRLDEAAHRLLMRAHQAAGESARALAVYEGLRARLVDELGADPARETRAVHQDVLAEAAQPPRGSSRSDGGGVLPGREAEVAVLSSAWSEATAGRTGIVLVAGEGGIGKTRLVEELRTVVSATGGRVLAARCYASERSLFLQPFVDVLAATLMGLPPGRLRSLCGSRVAGLAELWPQLAEVLGPADAPRGSVEMQVRRVFDAVTEVVRGLSSEQSTLLVIDDLHHAGLATIELLHYLGRHAPSLRLLVVATVRTGEGDAVLDALADVVERVDLGPLPAHAVTRLATEAGRSELAESILRRTRGHPLFVVETLRGLTAGEAGPPPSLQEAVLSRVRRLGPEVEVVLRAGAVLGASVDPELVAGLLDVVPHVAALRCAQAAGEALLTVADRRFEFANDLIQEILYATTPAPLRVVHHRRAADLTARWPEVVGRHAVAAGDWPRAARAFLLAGEQALGRYAAADAEALFTAALDASERVGVAELLCRALLGRGRTRDACGRYRLALGDFQAALTTARQARDRRAEMHALHGLGGHAAAALGRPISECDGQLREALAIAEALGDREACVDLLARLAVVQTNRLRFVDALTLARRAVAVARTAHTDEALALGLDGLKNAYAYLGEVGPLTEVIGELEPMLRRMGDLERLQWTVFESAIPAIAAANWAQAEHHIRSAVEIGHDSGLVGHEVWFVAHLGWVARLQGRVDDALTNGRMAVELAHHMGDAWFGPGACALLACTFLEVGDLAAAVPLLREGLDGASREGAEAYRLRCVAPLAEATGDPDVLREAESLLAAVEAPPEAAFVLGADIYMCLARAHLRQGDPERGRVVLAPLLAAAQRLDWIPVLVSAGLLDARARIALGDGSADAERERLIVLGERHGMTPLLMTPVLQRRCNDRATPQPRLVPTPDRGERERRHGRR
jgi:DNA-binding SARP family transcriptional activator/tetratricopeptide (TPR) repeat protein